MKTAETWQTGKVRRNRVRVRLRNDGVVRLEWYEAGKHRARYGFPRGAITDAIKDAARALARELHPNRTTYQPTDVLVAMRADLVRVARLDGQPEGGAPRRDTYVRVGRWSTSAIQAAFVGYYKKTARVGGGPLESWSKAVARFGLTPAVKMRHPNHVQLIQDLLRVAQQLGRPNELPSQHQYRKRGVHGPHSVMDTVGVRTWTELGAELGLSVPLWRFRARDRARGNANAARAASRRQHPTTNSENERAA